MLDEKLSKILSHALRHKPNNYDLELSKDGWVSIDKLVRGLRAKESIFSDLTKQDIINLVSTAVKKRHEILNNQIRALHGHSFETEIGQPVTPPSKLFHATARKYWLKIEHEGLKKMGRAYVHLSTLKQEAIEVAKKKIREY